MLTFRNLSHYISFSPGYVHPLVILANKNAVATFKALPIRSAFTV